MIAFIDGTVVSVGLSAVVIEVGGVGVEVLCAPRTLADLQVGRHARLPTSMVVREDSLTLFGFAEDEEKQTFELLQTASGVGPKLAQAMLAVHTPDDLRAAISSDDVKKLTAVPGVGTKGAQRIILELKDRMPAPAVAKSAAPVRPEGPDWREQVHSGLLGLGYSAKDADKAVAAISPEADAAPDASDPNLAALLKLALRSLSRS